MRSSIQAEAAGHDVVGANSSGFFGVGIPHPGALTHLLLEPKGLLILAPVWALGGAGLIVLWRAHRAEATLAAAVCVAFLLYDAGYYLPFGGFNSGPRFLVPMLPFLALGVAAAWRAFPGPTVALAIASAVVTTVSVLANPMIVSEDIGTMFHRLERGGDQNGPIAQTVSHWFWGAKIAPLLVVGVVVMLAVAWTCAPVIRRLTARDVLLGIASLVAWRIAYVGGTILARAPHGWVAAATLCLAPAAGIAALVRRQELAALPALALLVLLWPTYASHTGIALATVSVVLLASVCLAAYLPPRRAVSGATP